MELKIYKPTDRLLHPSALYFGAEMADIFKYHPDYIENAIIKYHDFAIDMEAFEKLPPSARVKFAWGYEEGFVKLNRGVATRLNEDIVSATAKIAAIIDDAAEKDKVYIEHMLQVSLQTISGNMPIECTTYQDEVKKWRETIKKPAYPKLEQKNIEWPVGNELLLLIKKFIAEDGYRPKTSTFKFSAESKLKNEEKIKTDNALSKFYARFYGIGESNCDYNGEYFDTMSNGQLGGYDDFRERGGGIDDIDDWAGR